MKKSIIMFTLTIMLSVTMYGQKICVPEPEFLNGYIHATSDSTYKKLPKEMGQFKKHESKTSKFAKIASAGAGVASGLAGIGASAGSVSGVLTGIRAATAAESVADVAGSLDLLAGMYGMDIVFDGAESTYQVPAGKDVNIVYKVQNNNIDPLDVLRIVKFKKGKKDRKIKWMNISSGILGSEESKKNGYLAFDASKYGESSYLITIPASELQEGEYGIISGDAASSTTIPIATFSVK